MATHREAFRGFAQFSSGPREKRVPPRGCATERGAAVPTKVMTNSDVARMVQTSDEWIRSRTGISERRIAEAGETTVSMGTLAAQRALERAGIAAREIDLVICASTTPDHLLPSSASLV